MSVHLYVGFDGVRFFFQVIFTFRYFLLLGLSGFSFVFVFKPIFKLQLSLVGAIFVVFVVILSFIS